MRLKFYALYILLLLLGAACAKQKPAIEDLSGQEDLHVFRLGLLGGTRDGDRLSAQATYTDSSSILTIDLNFRIGTPMTTLENGTWHWPRGADLQSGTITARSVTFFGGQSDGPSIGGTFDLLGTDGAPRYRINLPVTPLKTPLRVRGNANPG